MDEGCDLKGLRDALYREVLATREREERDMALKRWHSTAPSELYFLGIALAHIDDVLELRRGTV